MCIFDVYCLYQACLPGNSVGQNLKERNALISSALEVGLALAAQHCYYIVVPDSRW